MQAGGRQKEFDQQIPQYITADQPRASWGRATQTLQLQDILKQSY